MRVLASLSIVAAIALSITSPAHARCGQGAASGPYVGAPSVGARVAPSVGPRVAPLQLEVDLDQDDDGPVIAGAMSREAAEAKRLFEAERWIEAAPALARIARGDTEDDEGNRRLARYHLGIALYRLDFPVASLGVFTGTLDRPAHLGSEEALRWLARLDARLPEVAGVGERVGKYSLDSILRFRDPEQPAARARLDTLLGWSRYRARRYEEAIAAFEQVDRTSASYIEAQFVMGMAYTLLRKKVPAVKSFLQMRRTIEEGPGGDESKRLRQLATISIARAYYSGAIPLDENCAPSIDANRVSVAVKEWSKIELDRELWPEAQLEQSWAFFMAGDYPHALGNLHNLESGYFEASLYPEADIVRALIAFTTCQYDDVETHVARMERRYLPIRRELAALVAQLEGEPRDELTLAFYEQVRAGRAQVSAMLRPIVTTVLTQRRIGHHRDYLRVIAEEEARLQKAPASLRGSPLGDEVASALLLAQSASIHAVADLVRATYQARLDELDAHLLDARKLLIDTAAARRARAARPASSPLFRADQQIYAQVRPDDEHVIWPFDGEFWKDELGYYRQRVVSSCGSW